KLYNANTHSFIHTLPLHRDGGDIPPAFSPDCTRLAIEDAWGNVNLWDLRGIDASSPPSKGNATAAITALTLSRDCSRLACGFLDGTVELWETSPTKRRIDLLGPLPLRSKTENCFFRIFRRSPPTPPTPPTPRHTNSVRALGFDPDGRLFASGSDDGTIKLWNGGDGILRGTIKVPGGLEAVALSNTVLVAGGRNVTLWSLDTLRPIHTFYDRASKVSIAENSTLIAVCFDSFVTLFDVVNHTTIRTFDDDSFDIHTMSFLPDSSHLVVQSSKGVFRSFNLINNHTTEDPTLEHLVQLPNTPLWHGVPIWHCQNEGQHYFAASFSQHTSPVPVLWIPKQISVTKWTQGSSMIALGCEDGRVILLRLPTSHVS
ncbi:hypothetical protein M378DRAFT_173566, partial [Amanita muscaria Koide BX008]